MTIHELLQAAGLTANDEIPIWDVDGTGEPTKKITAQQLAAAVGALANLVTGVKGNAESSYRTGNVNLTPANIGALPDTTTFVSGVKGDAERRYRTGNVNITPANIGAVQLIVDSDSKTSYSFDMAFPGGPFKLGLLTYCTSGFGTANGAALYLIAIGKSGEIAIQPLSLGSAAPTVTAFSRVNDTVTMTFSGTIWGGIRILWLGNGY